jgi:putative transposase
MTLPSGDSDFSGRWRRIKGAFTRGVVAAGVAVSRNHRGEYSLWQKRFWEHTIRDDGDFERCAPTTFISIRSSMDWCHRQPRGHFPRGIGTPAPVCWPRIGEAVVSPIMSISVNAKIDQDFASLHPRYHKNG